jgi:regulator of RNase E activity RraA
LREACAELARFDSPTVSNAIEALGIRDNTDGYASAEIRSAFPDLPPLVGLAVTCTHDSTTGGPTRPTRLFDLLDAIEATGPPVIVVSQYAGSDRIRGCFAGDMAAAMYRQLGAVGVVTDSANRDVDMIAERVPGFGVFGIGRVSSHGNGAILDVSLPVVVGGLRVRPGDLLFADADGVISVPLEAAEDVVAMAERVRADERRFFDMLADPDVTAGAVREYLEQQRVAPGHDGDA